MQPASRHLVEMAAFPDKRPWLGFTQIPAPKKWGAEAPRLETVAGGMIIPAGGDAPSVSRNQSLDVWRPHFVFAGCAFGYVP